MKQKMSASSDVFAIMSCDTKKKKSTNKIETVFKIFINFG